MISFLKRDHLIINLALNFCRCEEWKLREKEEQLRAEMEENPSNAIMVRAPVAKGHIDTGHLSGTLTFMQVTWREIRPRAGVWIFPVMS